MENSEKFRIEAYLSRLGPNLPVADDARPSLDETLRSYANDAALRAKIAALAQSGGSGRFYAALLLWPVDKPKALEILNELADDETNLTVQKSIGHGLIELPLYFLAEDFVADKSFPGENLRSIEMLDNWKSAIVAEKRQVAQPFDDDSLPSNKQLLKSRKNPERQKRLRTKIAPLAAGSAAERFYAAAVFQFFDKAETRRILEGLLDEPAAVGVMSGDIMLNLPASQVAARLLGRNVPAEEAAPENQNPLARFFKWLGG